MGGRPEPFVVQFLSTIQTIKKLCQQSASRYTVLPNRKEAGFQYIIVGTKKSTSYCLSNTTYLIGIDRNIKTRA